MARSIHNFSLSASLWYLDFSKVGEFVSILKPLTALSCGWLAFCTISFESSSSKVSTYWSLRRWFRNIRNFTKPNLLFMYCSRLDSPLTLILSWFPAILSLSARRISSNSPTACIVSSESTSLSALNSIVPLGKSFGRQVVNYRVVIFGTGASA